MWQSLPTDLTDLVERLDNPHAVADAMRTAPLPALQAAEALQALGGRASRQELLAFLAAPGSNTATADHAATEAA